MLGPLDSAAVLLARIHQVRSRALSKGLTARNFRHMFLRPSDTDLDGMRPHVDPLHEERFELMVRRVHPPVHAETGS